MLFPQEQSILCSSNYILNLTLGIGDRRNGTQNSEFSGIGGKKYILLWLFENIFICR